MNTLVAAEAFYLLSVSQLLPSIVTRRQGQAEPISYAPAIGIVCAVISQVIFSQWSLMNQLFDTVPLNLVQAAICAGLGLPVIIVGLLLNRFDPVI